MILRHVGDKRANHHIMLTFYAWNSERGNRDEESNIITEALCPVCDQETWVRFLGGEDLLEKEMATHSNILAWRIPRTEEPGRL